MKKRVFNHKITRDRQDSYSDKVHHPDEKINQIYNVLHAPGTGAKPMSIFEPFAGQGNLTEIYDRYGSVLSNEKNRKNYEALRMNIDSLNLKNVTAQNVDSYFNFHYQVAVKSKFTVVDLDDYGFPTRFFPDVFLLIENGYLFVTMPLPSVNILNGITRTHLTSYFGEHNPSLETIVERIALWGLCHWRQVELIDSIKLGKVWRLAFRVKKVKATDYTGVKNR